MSPKNRLLLAFGLLAALCAAGLSRIGFWQLERAVEKERLLAGIESALAAPLLPLASAERDGAGLRFRAVRIQGRFDAGKQILLDNQLREGKPGVRAYVPFLIEDDDRAVLVDLGWLPWPDRASAPPQASTGLNDGALEGMLVDPPGAGLALGASAAADWPWLMTRMDIAAIEQRLGVPLLDLILEDRHARSATSIRAGMLPPERHRGYALQWFALALAVVLIYLTLAWRDLRRGDRPELTPSNE